MDGTPQLPAALRAAQSETREASPVMLLVEQKQGAQSHPAERRSKTRPTRSRREFCLFVKREVFREPLGRRCELLLLARSGSRALVWPISALIPTRCPRLRRSPVDGWATYVATARVLSGEGLVNRELLDVRGSLQLGAGGGHRGSDPRLERVEVLA